MRRPAPRLGEHQREVMAQIAAQRGISASPPDDVASQTSGPLHGVRVLDFTWVWAGPFCTGQLARLGAEVIRIETAKHPCVGRTFVPQADGKVGLNRGGSFNEKNHNKLSVQLDLQKPEAVEIVRQLARHCDIAAENFAPGVIDRLGVGYERLRAARPDLIMISLAGFGQTGPFRDYVSYGPIMAAHSAMQTLTTYPGDHPRSLGVSYGDPVIGIFGAYLLNAALIHRGRTGQGQYIDLSNLEALEMLMPEALLEYAMNRRDLPAMGNHDRWMSPHNCYKTAGDAEHWVTIAVGTEDEWRALCGAIGKPSMADDPRFSAPRCANKTKRNWIGSSPPGPRSATAGTITETLQRAGVAAIPTFGNKDIATDPHLRERGFLVDLDHPDVGVRTYAGVPWTMSVTPLQAASRLALPGPGHRLRTKEILGYTPDRIEELRATGIIC